MTEERRSRGLARKVSAQLTRGMDDTHCVRRLIEPADFASIDPFLLLMEDHYGPGVFAPHPHRGMETLTYLIEGELEHYDNHGAQALIGPGEALLLTAGKGLVHDERPATGGRLHILQLWVNLPRSAKLVPASVQALRPEELPIIRAPGVEARLFSGTSNGLKASTRNHVPLIFVDVSLQPGAVFTQDLPAGFNGFVYALDGRVEVGPSRQHVSRSELAWLEPADEPSRVTITGVEGPGRLVLAAGLPLREPVVARGPFVMNTEAEIEEAYADFRRTQLKFGT
jgi:quercetin 2,3-dioxygenase